MQGNSADDANVHRPRPVVFGRGCSHAQSGTDAGGGERLSHRSSGQHRRTDERAVRFARDRQIDGDRPAAGDQGRTGRRSEDRQRRRPLDPARLYHRRRGRPDQYRLLRLHGRADRGLRHRGQARPQRRARRAEAVAAEFGHPDRWRRRRRGIERLGSEPDRGAAGRRYRRPPRGRRGKGRQFDRRPRPRPGDAEGYGRRSRPQHRQAVGHRSHGQHELRHRGREIQQLQSVYRPRPPAGRDQRDAGVVRKHSVSDGHAPRDGDRRRPAHAGRTQSDRDLGRSRDLHCRRRISGSRRLFLRSGHARLHHPDLIQEVRHFAQLHAGGDDRRTDQPSRHDGSLGTVERQLDHADAISQQPLRRTR